MYVRDGGPARVRFLGMQHAAITDNGVVALNQSQAMGYIWRRSSHGLHARGFRASSTTQKLRALSTSYLNVNDEVLPAKPDFPSPRELLPMDIPDAEFRHIGTCTDLEQLLLMYCPG